MKFNKTSVGTGPQTKTVNLGGGEAYTVDNRTALYLNVATSLGGGAGDGYYQTKEAKYANIISLIAKIAKSDPEFIFQLAAYTRNELKLRSIPTVLFVEGIRAMHKNKPAKSTYPIDASKYALHIFGRADEIVEAVAYWIGVEGGHKLPAPLRKALTLALNKFDEYRLLKYNQEDKAVTFKDIVRLIHPDPKNDVQSAIFRYFVKDEINAELMPKTAARKQLLTLKEFDDEARQLMETSFATWETITSKFGSTKEIWEALIPNMGYMALLRNLNNFLKKDVNVAPVIARLTNPEEVRNSKQLPFRFYSAMKAVKSDETQASPYSRMNHVDAAFGKWKNTNSSDKKGALLEALGVALNLSIVNVSMQGRTLIGADLSGSMGSMLNAKSTVSCREIACVMAAIAASLTPDNIACGFGDTFAVAKAGKNILETANNIDRLQVGHSTHAHLLLDYLFTNRIFVDRVMYFTDGNVYGGSISKAWDKYKDLCQSSGKKVPFLYEVNLAGGNTTNFHADKNVVVLAGFSDRIFDLITTYETDPRQSIKKIKEKYTLTTKELIEA